MKMKEISVTTPFEDLILGSQFVPVLARTKGTKGEKGEPDYQKNIGIFQCRRCGSTFLQEKEALSHYKSHVLETHKEYFSVVFGGLCFKKGCVFVQRSDPAIHFHCSHCRFTACEILDLPLHMEEQHLSFYKEVSLILSKEDAQLNKVYKCGECNLNLQGKVSILQHLLTHETNPSSSSSSPRMDLTNGASSSPPHDSAPLVNGLTSEVKEQTEEEEEEEGEEEEKEAEKKGMDALMTGGRGEELEEGREEENKLKLNEGDKKENQEQMQIEINPLELISTLIEEDMKSDNPLFPTQHFLLGHANHNSEDNNSSSHEDISHGDHLRGPSYIPEEESEPVLPVNGFPLSAETYYDISPSPGVFQCNQCNEAFKYQYLLTAHKKQCHQGNILTPFKCHICGNEFTAIIDLKRHTVSIHSPNFCHFCQICGHAFLDPLSLKQHLVDHGKSNKKPVQQHVQNKEILQQIPVEKTICDGCSIEFPSKSELTRHIVKFQGTCNPNKTECLRCATCGDEMPTLEALKEHRRNSHPSSPPGEMARIGGKKGFQCDYCGKNFSCRSNLRDHLVVHTGEKPYPCDICGKAFSFIHNMKTHRLTHNEGRTEMCPYCDKAYKSKISLYYHMKKGNCRGLSTKEVPEGFRRCTECLQMFASDERFENHKTKGTCQMSYRCTHCGIRCSSQDKLDRHIQKGICTKTSDDYTDRRRRPRRRSDHRPEEPVCCERCNNYNRDCCCTFSCKFCNKRVFSIGAYISHKRFHLSPESALSTEGKETQEKSNPSKQRRERIRVAIMEKRRRKRRRRKRKGLSKGKKLQPQTCAPAVTENVAGEVTVAPSEQLDEVSEGDVDGGGGDGGFPDHHSESLSLNSGKETLFSVASTALTNDDDDSNSGSLTDLSTFISPNILKPVHSGPSTPVGGADGQSENLC